MGDIEEVGSENEGSEENEDFEGHVHGPVHKDGTADESDDDFEGHVHSPVHEPVHGPVHGVHDITE